MEISSGDILRHPRTALMFRVGSLARLLVPILTILGLSGSESLNADEKPSFAVSTSNSRVTRLEVLPQPLILQGNGSLTTILVDGVISTPESDVISKVDLTKEVHCQSLTPEIFTVKDGRLRGIQDGQGTLRIAFKDLSVDVAVKVMHAEQSREFHFENDLIPILSKFACNMSGCHGKAEGQNGFKLSVFGFDPKADFVALTQEGRGRRINPVLPSKSLLLEKASGGVPHGGGVRIAKTSEEYRTIHRWIEHGMPYGSDDVPSVASISVTPNERVLPIQGSQQLRVVANFTDGHQLDVTHHARFQSNNEAVAKVDEFGNVTAGNVPGDVAVMASYLGQVEIFRALVPRTERLQTTQSVPELNFIDHYVDEKLRKLQISVSPLCSDADFVRRVSLDLIGKLPTSAEVRSFLANSEPDRRRKLVDDLLQRPEFADYWALKWSDWLRVDRRILGHDGAYRYYRWIRESIAQNLPMDQFAREMLTSQGLLAEHPSGYFYKVLQDPGEMASSMSQALLGVRIECAKCHHHPFDRWSQEDYQGMLAYFNGMRFKPTVRGEMLLVGGGGSSRHPRTQAEILARPLGEPASLTKPAGDVRVVLADWMVSKENPYFAKNLVNRAWAHLFGRGLVDPVDDVRLTNPASHPELFDELAKDLITHDFDFRHILRTIVASRTYQLSSDVNSTNELDEQNYSRSVFRRLEAEVLLDAICDVTDVPEKFDGVPAGARAIQLWDSQVPHYFLGIFGRPLRSTTCDCERASGPNVSQVLHVLNSPEIHAKIGHEAGRVAQLAVADKLTDQAVLDELYLTFLNRFPSQIEKERLLKYLAEHRQVRRTALEDLAWSLMNSIEFVFNH